MAVLSAFITAYVSDANWRLAALVEIRLLAAVDEHGIWW